MKFYFFKTMSDKGRNRLRPLSGQFAGDGSKIDPSWNVRSDKTLRLSYPLGTVFGSDRCVSRMDYYEAGDIYPVSLREDEYIDAAHKPPYNMTLAYGEFIGVTTAESSEDDPDLEIVSEKPKKARMTHLEKMKRNKDLEVPYFGDGFYVEPNNWYLLLRNIQNQINTMLVGPTGTGKTELVMLACKKMGIPCHVYDMGSMYDPVAGLLGVHRLSKGGVSTFDYAKFTQDIQQPGVILLDELSRAPVTSLNILFPCLDSRRSLPVEIAGGDDLRSIKIHEDCCFIATANVGSEYTGTMSMDRALVGRFFPVELDYMPIDIETSVITNRCKIAPENARNITRVAQNIRSMYKKQEISCSISTRETLMAGELVADGWSTLQAMEMVFLPLFEGTKLDGERGIIAKILMSR